MGDDPLQLGGLDAEAIAGAVENRKKKGKDTPAAQLRAETAAKKEERLSSAGPSSAPPPPAPPPPEPPVEDKSKLLDKIQAYKERFPHLKSRNKLTAKASFDELLDEVHFLEQQLGQREGHMGHHVFFLLLSGVEEVTARHYNPLNLNLTGLGAVAKENESQFVPLLDELFIKYAMNVYVGPEMRLAMATATLIYTVHSANSGNPAVAKAMEAMSRQVPASVKKSDL